MRSKNALPYNGSNLHLNYITHLENCQYLFVKVLKKFCAFLLFIYTNLSGSKHTISKVHADFYAIINNFFDGFVKKHDKKTLTQKSVFLLFFAYDLF